MTTYSVYDIIISGNTKLFDKLIKDHWEEIEGQIHDDNVLHKLCSQEDHKLPKNFSYFVEKLIENGSDLDYEDSYGKTALDWALALRDVKTCKALIKAGASWNKHDMAIIWAVCHGNLSFFKKVMYEMEGWDELHPTERNNICNFLIPDGTKEMLAYFIESGGNFNDLNDSLDARLLVDGKIVNLPNYIKFLYNDRLDEMFKAYEAGAIDFKAMPSGTYHLIAELVAKAMSKCDKIKDMLCAL